MGAHKGNVKTGAVTGRTEKMHSILNMLGLESI